MQVRTILGTDMSYFEQINQFGVAYNLLKSMGGMVLVSLGLLLYLSSEIHAVKRANTKGNKKMIDIQIHVCVP